MKKLLALLLVSCLAVSLLAAGLAETAGAEANTSGEIETELVYIPEKQISIAVPKDFILIGRSDTELDSRLTEAGFDVDQMLAKMNQDNIYLYAIHPEFECDFNIIITDSALKRIGSEEASFLLSMMEETKESYAEMGLRITDYKTYLSSGGTYFIRMDGEMIANPSQKMIQALTIEDNQTIVITLTVYDGEITEEDIKLLETAAEKSVLKKHESNTGGEEAEASEYYYKDAGLHFMIPKGWEERKMTKERQTLKFKMSPINDNGSTSFMFGCQDAWEMLPEATRKEYGIQTRKDLDAFFSDNLASVLLEMDITDTRTVEYSGIKFEVYSREEETVLGTLPWMGATAVYNGYFIQFQMCDMSGLYGDVFEEVLNSIYFDET